MNGSTPRHREEHTPQQCRKEAEVVLALVAFVVCLGLLIWMATAWDAWPMAIGLVISGFLGTWWHEQRANRKKARQDREVASTAPGDGS